MKVLKQVLSTLIRTLLLTLVAVGKELAADPEKFDWDHVMDDGQLVNLNTDPFFT